jgi:hypothetical protein
MKKCIVFILVMTVLTGMMACKKKSTTPESTAKTIVGTWIRTHEGQLLTVVINANNTSAGTLGSQSLPSGTYSISGSQVSFTDSACPVPGVYSFSLNGDTLTMTLISDDCDGRYQLVPGIYSRV